MVLPVLGVSQLVLFGQSLQLSGVAEASRGEQVEMQLSLKSPGERKPVALQWDAEIPKRQISLVDYKVLAGSAAKEADKSVNCALNEKKANISTIRCILAGGVKPISDGVLAVVRFKIAPDANPAPVLIRVDEAMAVLQDGKNAPLDSVEAVIALRR